MKAGNTVAEEGLVMEGSTRCGVKDETRMMDCTCASRSVKLDITSFKPRKCTTGTISGSRTPMLCNF